MMLDTLHNAILTIDEYIWYLGLVLIIGIGLILTYVLKGIQVTRIRDAVEYTISDLNRKEKRTTISSLEAFWVSMGARIGVGNIAGVALAIILGGAGAIFWMWVFALIGAASSFAECTLGQLFKERKSDGHYHGGPAYYIKNGLKNPKFAIFIALLIVVTYGIGFIGVQSSNATSSFVTAFEFENNTEIFAIILTAIAGLIVFGGIKRVAKASAKIVPIMAFAWIGLAVITIALNWRMLDDAFSMIFRSAFDIRSAVGGGMGAAIMHGLRRGVFSNEAGIGSIPNVSSSAEVTHPVKQGLMQSMGVILDTMVVCTASAFIILTYTDLASLGHITDGAPLMAAALEGGPLGKYGAGVLSVFLILFAFTSIIGYYSMCEANMKFVSEKKVYSLLLKVIVVVVVLLACLAPVQLIWDLCDVFMAVMGISNMIAVLLLSKYVREALRDYRRQKDAGKDPVLNKNKLDVDVSGIPLWDGSRSQ